MRVQLAPSAAKSLKLARASELEMPPSARSGVSITFTTPHLSNVMPMSLLYVAFGVAWAVLAEASLSFLGFGDPRMVSWGQMLYAAYISGSIRHAWWSVVPPGLCITLFTASVFLIGREYERVVNPRLDRG